MARKPTVKEQRQAMIDAYFSDSYQAEEDPLVRDILARQKDRQQQAAQPKADFSDVESTVSSAPEESPESALNFETLMNNQFVQGISSLANKAISGTQQTLAGAIQRDEDQGGFSLDRLQSIIPSITVPQIDDVGNVSAAPVRVDSFLASILSGENPAGASSRERTIDKLVESAANNDKEAQRILDNTGFGNGLLQTAQDVAQSPESMLSVIGGPTAILPGATTYSREYLAGRQGGLTPDEADERATTQAGIEFGLSTIPTGKLFGVLGKTARSRVNNVALDALKRVGATSAGESLQEGATTIAQLAADAELAQNSKSDTVQQFAQANLPKSLTEYWDQVWRSMKAGALGGAAFDSPSAMFEASAEAGRRAGNIMSGIDDGKARAEARQTAESMYREGTDLKSNAITPTRSEAEVQFPEQVEAAYRQRDEQQEAELRQQDQTNLELGTRDLTRSAVPETAMAKALQQSGALDQMFRPRAEPAGPVGPVVEETPAPVVPAPTVKKTRVKKDTEQRQNEWNSLLTNLPKASQGGANSGVTLDEVGRILSRSAGTKGGGQVSGLVESGTLNFVQSKDDLDIQGLAENSKGYYDPESGKVYIVADQLDRKNIKGDVLSVLAHEVKHGADIGGSESVRASFRNVVGDAANSRINQQIRALAQQDSADGRAAKKVVDFVEDKYDSSDWQIELPAVYLQQQRDARNGVVRNALSAVRTRYKQVTGNDDLNLNDLAYMADQIVSDVAQRGDVFKPTRGNAKSTFLGRKAKNFATAEELGLTYDSKDGGRKYWLSDRGSTVKFTDKVTNAVKQHDGDVDLKLSTIMQHEALYNEYPQLKDLVVSFTDNINPKFRGAYYPDENVIRMNKKFVDAGTFNTPTHQILLHEVQHAVQNIEGHEPGSTPGLFLPDTYDDDIAALEEANEQLAEFGRDAYRGSFKKYGVNMMDPKAKEMAARAEAGAKAEMDSEMYNNKNVDAGVAAAQAAILELSKYEGSYTGDIKELHNLDKFAENLSNKTQKQFIDATRKYLNNLGEREAKFTEKNIDTPVDVVPDNPEATKFPTADVSRGTPQEVVRPKASISMPRDIDELADQTSEAFRIAQRLFTPTSGFGHELKEIQLHSRNLVASNAAKAEDLGRGLAEAIRENVKQTGIPEDQLRDQIEKELQAVDALDTPEKRAARMDSIDRKYPGVGRAVNGLRDFKMSLTRQLIHLRARDPEPLTEKELAVYQKAIQRAETYTTRAYLTSLGGKQGRQFAESMMRKAKKNPNSPEGRKVAAASEWLINNQLMVPSMEGLKQMKMDQLRRLHDQWIGPADNFKGAKGKAIMIDRLNNLTRKSRSEMEDIAQDVIKQLIGLTPQKGAIATYYSGGRQNRTVLETRRNIPKELRDVMGEITDPYLREMLSIARMTQLMAKTKMLTEIFENGKGRWWSDTKRDGFEQQLTGASYGPMAGKYANKDVFDLLTDVTLYNANTDALLADAMGNPTALSKMAVGVALPFFSKVAGLQKIAQIVLSPAAMAFNFAGALGMILPQNGIMPGGPTTGRALRDAARVVQATAFKHQNPEALARTQEILRAGVMDSATVGEFQGKVYDDIFREIQRLNPDDSNFIRKSMRIISSNLGKGKAGADFLRETYAFMDVWAKVATYYNRKEFLTDYNRLNNGDMTQEQIERQAGYEATLTNISYNMAIPAARLIERNVPVISMFLTYFSEVPRSLAFSYAQVYKDAQLAKTANTAAARNLAIAQASKRFVGTTLVTSGLTAAVVAALDGEDEDERKRRQLDPDYERNNPRIVLGKDENGNDVTVSLGRIDPNGPLNEAVRNVVMAPKGEKADALMESAKGLFVRSESIVRTFQFFSDAVMAGIGADELDMKRKKNTATERNFTTFYNAVSNFFSEGDLGENGLAALEMFLPAPVLGALDPSRTPTTKEAPTASTAARLMGYKSYVRDPDKNFTFRTYDYNKALKSLRTAKNDLFERSKTMSESELTEAVSDLTMDEQKAFDNLSSAYEGYTAFEKKTAAGAYAIMKETKIPKETISAVRYNRFQPTVVTRKTINDWYKKQVKQVPAEERPALIQRRNMLIRAFAGKEE